MIFLRCVSRKNEELFEHQIIDDIVEFESFAFDFDVIVAHFELLKYFVKFVEIYFLYVYLLDDQMSLRLKELNFSDFNFLFFDDFNEAKVLFCFSCRCCLLT